MDNLRYLLAAIAALTLIMSVVSGVNPSYFAGLNAFADHDDEDNEEDSDDNSGSSNDNDEDNDDDDGDDKDNKTDDEDEDKIVKTLGNNSKVALEIDDDAELQVEIEDGDLDNGTYDVMFACTSPDVDEEFADALEVEDGEGEFEEDLSLTNGTYSGCEIEVGDLSATFPSFTIAANDDEDEEGDDEEDDDNNGRGHKDDDEHGSSRGSNDDDGEDDDNNNSGRGSDDEEDEEDDDNGDDDKRKERKQRIVNSTSGSEIHKRHRGENAASPGDYKPGWNYTLEAEGEATEIHGEDLAHEANVTTSVDMSIWKSNRAIILFDIVGGTIEVEGQDYDVRIGYAIYSIQHDAMKVAALATDDDGNVFRLKLRGSAVDGSDQFPMETGSIDMVFGGDVNDRFEDWNLLLEGTIEAN